MKLIYLNKNLIYIPSVILQVKTNNISIKINSNINFIRNEIDILIKPIENISSLKLNLYNFDDYLYKFNLSKFDNNLYIIQKIPEYLLNYQYKNINTLTFIKNL